MSVVQVVAIGREWMIEARCLGTDPEVFFSGSVHDQKYAKRLCVDCPVIKECLEYTERYEETSADFHGVWGGLSANQRRLLKGVGAKTRGESKKQARYVEHGTRSGYVKHKRQGEEPCEECREGMRKYYREWEKKKRRKEGS